RWRTSCSRTSARGTPTVPAATPGSSSSARGPATRPRWRGSSSFDRVTLFDPEESVTTTAPSGPSFRVRVTVAYDGSGFRGFAEQKTVPTVGGALREALELVLGHPVDITCAGRTDAGVHAWGQVVSFDALGEEGDVDLELVRRSVTKMLGPRVVVRDAA